MALNAPAAWLIAYDIADQRRLGRLGRFIKKHAIPAQYSLYYYEGSDAALRRLMQEIEVFIDPRVDDVRAYKLPANPCIDVLGRGSLPNQLTIHSGHSSAIDYLLHAAKPESL